MKATKVIIVVMLSFIVACNDHLDQADAYGNFEAIEVLVSTESQGKIVSFELLEGAQIAEGQKIALIDTLQLHLKKKQLLAAMVTVQAKLGTLEAQVNANRVQLANLQREKERIDNLVYGGAATPKQLDDLTGQVELMNAQIETLKSQRTSINAELNTLKIQVEQVEDQMQRSTILNPVEGVMLTKFKERGEIVVPGQPLYKVANMDQLLLRAYVTGMQLAEVEIGKEVTILFDTPDGIANTPGEVIWISSRAEFTPKIIQTREERVSLVYAIKVVVSNDGRLKIGMPGEVKF